MLPPQMRRMDASAPENPIETAAAASVQDSPREITAEWFGQMDVYSRLREVYDIANRNNTAIYSLDPRGLAVFEFGIDDIVRAAAELRHRSPRAADDAGHAARALGGDRRPRHRQPQHARRRDSRRWSATRASTTCSATRRRRPATDGKFHEIKVRVKRRGVDVRARKGYWALTTADVEKISESHAGRRQAGADGAGVDRARRCRPASTCGRGSAPSAARTARRA